MRMLGATFATVDAAETARVDLEHALALPPGTFRRATLGDRGQPEDGRPLLAGIVPDTHVSRAHEILRQHGGMLVADVRDPTRPSDA